MSQYGWESSNPKEAHGYIIPKILELLPGNQPLRILDAGCGNGFLAGKLAELGHEVIGIDLAEDGIQIAQAAYPKVQFFANSVYEIPADLVDSFDYVVSTEVIEHLYYPGLFLNNVYRCIRPGGYLILTTPYHGYLKNLVISIFGKWDKHFTVQWEGGHVKFFSANTIVKMLSKAGFSNFEFNNAGRVKYLWKSMVCKAQKLKN